MTKTTINAFTLLAFSASLTLAQAPKQPPPPMSFFVTSSGPGKGADLGGITGADQRCQMLAQAAGAGDRTWHAYLSAQAKGGQPAVNAAIASARDPGSTPKAAVSRRIFPISTEIRWNRRASATRFRRPRC